MTASDSQIGEVPVEEFIGAGWWERSLTLSDLVRRHAEASGGSDAYRWGDASMTWAEYDSLADAGAALLLSGCAPGDRALVWLPDGGGVHAAYLACERAGVVAVGVGWRAGRRELGHLVERTGASLAVLPAETPLGPAADLAEELGIEIIVLDDLDAIPNFADHAAGASTSVSWDGIGPSELWMLNSTSGTTGLPKCVMQNQNRWFYFHQKAVAAGQLGPDFGYDEVWMSVVPAPFGFGLWTAHVTPTMLGAPCTVQAKFDAAAAVDAIEAQQVTVLAAVSSQFVMILDAAQGRDLSSLRVVFTGGEAISPTRAAALEAASGCRVLNFYGSNETGMLSGTTIEDPVEQRLSSAGRVVPEMNVRLYDPDSGDRIVGDTGRGVPACHGPALALGYWDDDAANDELRTDDGWFLMGDVVEIDPDGWVSVVGRTSDIVIRGGKNISAVAVEEEVATHPAVVLVAVVAAPDERLGEIAVAHVQLRPGATLTLDELTGYLAGRGVSVEWWPERLVVMDELPVSSGGKIAKAQLRST